MPGINGVQPGSKPIQTQQSEETPTPAKTESTSAKEAAKDQFETPKEANGFNFASGPAVGEALTAKGRAYLQWKENQSHAPGEARTAKGQAYEKWKETHNEETGKALTAKGQAYQKMMQAEANEILRQQAAEKPQPGEAPRAKKQSSH